MAYLIEIADEDNPRKRYFLSTRMQATLDDVAKLLVAHCIDTPEKCVEKGVKLFIVNALPADDWRLTPLLSVAKSEAEFADLKIDACRERLYPLEDELRKLQRAHGPEVWKCVDAGFPADSVAALRTMKARIGELEAACEGIKAEIRAIWGDA